MEGMSAPCFANQRIPTDPMGRKLKLHAEMLNSWAPIMTSPRSQDVFLNGKPQASVLIWRAQRLRCKVYIVPIVTKCLQLLIFQGVRPHTLPQGVQAPSQNSNPDDPDDRV